MKIALAGPPQSGKTENSVTFINTGWLFINLNETGDALRRIGGSLRPAFESLTPGEPILDSAGKRQVAYYKAVQRDPSVLQEFTILELPHIIKAAEASLAMEGNLVLSWEQWELIAGQIQVDHFLFLDSGTAWIERLRRRAYKRGYTGQPLPDEVLVELMTASGFSPSQMLKTLVEKVGRDRVIVVDTSADDWGAENIQRALTTLVG